MLIKLLQYWASRSRVEVISGHGSDTPYLVRYHLLNNRFCKLYLHYFLRSDLDDPHDHPWNFWTLMLQGAYTEELYNWRTRTFKQTRRTPVSNSLIGRKATDIHRIITDESIEMDEFGKWRRAPMTLFFAFRKYQEWGFVENYKDGPRWKVWSAYLAEHFGKRES